MRTMGNTELAGPLDGVKVLDFSVMISGPLAAMMLADQGADVIKVDRPDSATSCGSSAPTRAG